MRVTAPFLVILGDRMDYIKLNPVASTLIPAVLLQWQPAMVPVDVHTQPGRTRLNGTQGIRGDIIND